MLVDTGGLLLRVVVHAANVSDRDGATHVLSTITERFPRLSHLWVDAGYRGKVVTWMQQTTDITVTVVQRPRRWMRWPDNQAPPPPPPILPVLPRRWVVERTFAWLGRYRRLSKDYEALPATEEAWIHLAMSSLMLARLAQ